MPACTKCKADTGGQTLFLCPKCRNENPRKMVAIATLGKIKKEKEKKLYPCEVCGTLSKRKRKYCHMHSNT